MSTYKIELNHKDLAAFHCAMHDGAVTLRALNQKQFADSLEMTLAVLFALCGVSMKPTDIMTHRPDAVADWQEAAKGAKMTPRSSEIPLGNSQI